RSRRRRPARDRTPPPLLADDFLALHFDDSLSLAERTRRADPQPLAGCVIRSTTGQTVVWWQLVALIGSEMAPAWTTSAVAPSPLVRPTICTALSLPSRSRRDALRPRLRSHRTCLGYRGISLELGPVKRLR